MVPILDEMEAYASLNNIPIMQKDGIAFLEEYIRKNHVYKILEIGAAIGYSSIRMANISEKIKVVTVERDENRYKEALSNIKKANKEKQITLYHMDAFDLELEEEFDLIFIDAAKSQYIRFFEKFKKNLKQNGTIISDNLSFHGLVETDKESESRNVRGLVRKLRNYISFLKDNEEFETTFVTTGDGIGITKYKK
ncbi:MAG: O-methyltransferase [Bacilli bacterium]|nr:O-methyltransferase [Bacilli bacterium]